MVRSLNQILGDHLWEWRRPCLALRHPANVDDNEAIHLVVSARLVSEHLVDSDCREFACASRKAWNVSVTLLSIRGQVIQPRVLKQRWCRYYENPLKHIRSAWLAALPSVDRISTAELMQNLTTTTNAETIVDFSDAGARSGYIEHRVYKRGQYLAEILLQPAASSLRAQLLAKRAVHVVNIGGGPGFDAIGLQLLTEFFGAKTKFHHEVIDIEAGWQDAVTALGEVLKLSGTTATTEMKFRMADLRELGQAMRKDSVEDFSCVDLFIFAYVCIENADSLRRDNFMQLKSMFAMAKLGAAFVFFDSSDRLWPAVLKSARESARYEAMFMTSGGKIQMILVRVESPSFSSIAQEMDFLKVCTEHAQAHEASINRRLSSSIDVLSDCEDAAEDVYSLWS